MGKELTHRDSVKVEVEVADWRYLPRIVAQWSIGGTISFDMPL